MRYPIELKPDGKFFLVTFADIPEAITHGRSRKEALAMPAEALATALDFYSRYFGLPIPSESFLNSFTDNSR